MQNDDTDHLPIPLYHGTSSIFLDGIIESGLGGCNQLEAWKVLEFARALHPFVHEHLSSDPAWMVKAQSFGFMVGQRSGAMNFQHGDAYLSPSSATAVRYAVNKRFGSELLSYTLDLLQELLHREVPRVADDLYRESPHLFNLLDISCAPLLVRVERPARDELVAEDGSDVDTTFNHVLTTLRERGASAENLLQQSNFRLRRPIPVSRLSAWLVNVKRWSPLSHDYSLHKLCIGANHEDGQQPNALGRLPQASPASGDSDTSHRL